MIENQEAIQSLNTRLETAVRANDLPTLELIASEFKQIDPKPQSLCSLLPGMLSIALEQKYNKISKTLITEFGTPIDKLMVQGLFLLDYLVKTDNFSLLSDLHANKVKLDFSIYFFNITSNVHQHNQRVDYANATKVLNLESVVRFAQFYAWVAKHNGHQILTDLKTQLQKEKMHDTRFVTQCLHLVRAILASSLSKSLTTDHILNRFTAIDKNPRWNELQTKTQLWLDLLLNIKLTPIFTLEASPQWGGTCYVNSENRKKAYERILSSLNASDAAWIRQYAVNANMAMNTGMPIWVGGAMWLLCSVLADDNKDINTPPTLGNIIGFLLVTLLASPVLVPASLIAARILSLGSLKIGGNIQESTASAVVNLELNKHAKYVGSMYQNHKKNSVSLNTRLRENEELVNRDDQLEDDSLYIRLLHN